MKSKKVGTINLQLVSTMRSANEEIALLKTEALYMQLACLEAALDFQYETLSNDIIEDDTNTREVVSEKLEKLLTSYEMAKSTMDREFFFAISEIVDSLKGDGFIPDLYALMEE